MLELLKSIINDLKSPYKIKGNKWHLHIPIGAVLGFLSFVILNPTFNGVPDSFKFFINTFVVFCLAFFWEWYQGFFYGANTTKEEVFEAKKDIIVSTLGGLIGVIIYYICFL